MVADKLPSQLAALFAGFLLAGCGAPSSTEATSKPQATGAVIPIDTPPRGQLPEGVRPTAYRLALETDPDAGTFSGEVEIDIALDVAHARIWLHALGPEVSHAEALLPNGQVIEASFKGNLAEGGVSRLDFDTPLPAGTATLALRYKAPYNLALAGLYKSIAGDAAYLATQMEPIDARRAFPSFDEPRFKTPWTISVIAPAGQAVVTNGPVIRQTDLGDGRTRHDFAPTRAIQSYLVALAVGPYDEQVSADIPANAIRDRAIPLRGFAAAGKGEKLTEALASTAQLLTIQEDYFDYPYPYAKLDLLAVPDFAYGAMENAGAIIYREGALLIDERTSLSQKRRILAIHAHELAHQWFGNLVTPKWWDDIWLNEAFATWMSYKTMHAYDPEGGFDRLALRRGLSAMNSDALINARQIRNPILRNADILDAFDGITYSKGGSVLNMFEAYLGEAAFREGMRLHMRRFEDGVADAGDFMTSLATGSGNSDVVPSFSSFIFQPGTPFLDVETACSADGTGILTVKQSRYAPLGSDIDPRQVWKVPFAARTSTGKTIRQLLSAPMTEISLENCADWVLPNAGGTGYWRFTTSDENWSALIRAFDGFSPGEQLVLSDSLIAAFKAGQIPASTMLRGIRASTSGAWDSVTQPLGSLATLASLLDDDPRQDFEAWLRSIYQPVLDQLSNAEAPLSQGDTLLKESLTSLMATTARDETIRSALLARAEAYVGVSGRADPDALTPAELRTAMAIGAEEGGTDFFDAALAHASASDNQTERIAIFFALGANAGAEDAIRLFEEALSERLSGRDMFSTLLALTSNPYAQGEIWPLFQARFADIAEKLPEIRKPAIARVAGQFCTLEDASEAEAFFKANGKLIPGYERTLAQATESARLCATLRASKSEELANAVRR